MLFFFFLDLELDRSLASSLSMIDSTRTIGWSSAKREFFFFLLFFREIRVDSFLDERSLFVDASSSHSRFLGGNVDYDVRCIEKGTRGR